MWQTFVDFFKDNWQSIVAFGVLLGIFVNFIVFKNWLFKPKSSKSLEKDSNQKPKSYSRKSTLNNLPPIDSVGELLGSDRKRKAKEILKLIKKYRVVVIKDDGGIGKSTLARDIAEKSKKKRKKLNAIIWISAKMGETGMNTIDLNYILDTIAQVLDYRHILSNDVSSKRSAVIKILQEKNVFFIFDNFETITDVQIYSFIESIPEHDI